MKRKTIVLMKMFVALLALFMFTTQSLSCVYAEENEPTFTLNGTQTGAVTYGTAGNSSYAFEADYISNTDWSIQWYDKDGAPISTAPATMSAQYKNIVLNYDGLADAGEYQFTITCDGITSGKTSYVIKKRKASITSDDAKKVYNGSPLTRNAYTTSGFVNGDGVSVTCTGSQTEIGTSSNTFTYTALEGTNLDNYVITKKEGELSVVDEQVEPFVIVGENYYGTYDGREHTLGLSLIGKNGVDYTNNGEVTTTYYTSSSGSNYELSNEPSITDAGTIYCKVVAQYQGKTITAYFTMTVAPRTVILTSASATKEYDGTPLTKNDPVNDITISGDGFLNDTEKSAYTIAFREWSSMTKAGSGANEFSCIFTDHTKALAGNYNIVTNYGQLTVTPKSTPITITTSSNSKTYDGSAIDAGTVDSNFKYVKVGNVKLTVTLKYTGENAVKDAGTYKNDITAIKTNDYNKEIEYNNYKVVDENGEDVTGCYTFAEPVIGTLTIGKRNVTLTSATDYMEYDGITTLTNSNVAVTGDGWAGDEGATYNVTGSQKEKGSSKNTFTYSAKSGTNLDNYNITKVEGDLIVEYASVDASKSENVSESNGKLSSSFTKGSVSDIVIDLKDTYNENVTAKLIDKTTNKETTLTCEEGSIKVTIPTTFINTLSVGTHNYNLKVMNNGADKYSYDLSITIKDNSVSSNDTYKVVKTGVDGTDNTLKLVSLLSLVTIAGVVTLKKRKH